MIMRWALFLCLGCLASCYQICIEDDLRTVPTTNNPLNRPESGPNAPQQPAIRPGMGI